MQSIVGITSNPPKSKMAWERKVAKMVYWKIVGHYPLQKQAIIFGENYASILNAEFVIEPGNPDSMWYVYSFDYSQKEETPTETVLPKPNPQPSR